MRNRNYLSFISLLALLVSCSSKQDNEVLLKEIASGLSSSTNLAHVDAMNTLHLFKMKLYDPVTVEKAKLFYPRVQRVYDATTDIVGFIDSLKQLVQIQTETNDKNVKQSKTVKALLIDNGLYKKLYKKLKQYTNQILFADSMGLGHLKDYITIINKAQDKIDDDSFLKYCLTSNVPVGTLAYLNLLQNNLEIAQSRCIRFYNESIVNDSFTFDLYEPLISQNAKVLQTGEYLEISGGLGAFSIRKLLHFSIGGRTIGTNGKGIGVYKFKTSKKPGHYSIPISIRFLDEDNKEQSRTFEVKYMLVDTSSKL